MTEIEIQMRTAQEQIKYLVEREVFHQTKLEQIHGAICTIRDLLKVQDQRLARLEELTR